MLFLDLNHIIFSLLVPIFIFIFSWDTHHFIFLNYCSVLFFDKFVKVFDFELIHVFD